MKRIISVLLVLIMNFGYSENLDKYESKRVFDKTIDCFVNGDCQKYKNDKEMRRSYEDIEENIETKYFYEYSRNFIKDNKYVVIDMKEMKNESHLKVNVIYLSYKNIHPVEYAMLSEKAVLELKEEEKTLTGLDYLNILSSKMYNGMKDKVVIKTKTIDVYMDRKDGLWDIESSERNNEFLDILLSYLGLEYTD